MRGAWKNLALVVCATLFSLAVMEAVSRFVYPVSAGPRFVAADGRPIASWNDAGRTYRQVASEYDAKTTITSRGYRIPEITGNPEVIFIGDSYTFGVGLHDEETFPFQYASAKRIACVNLALPGIGTGEEVDRLQRALVDWGWKPGHVKLFMFAMTTSKAGGNDIVDNLDYHPADVQDRAQKKMGQGGGLWSGIYHAMRTRVLSLSNLARILKFHFGTEVRSVVTHGIDPGQLALSLERTRRHLLRLDALSRTHGFSYEIYLIHPVQDIVRGTAEETRRTLQAIAPVPIRGTAHLFSRNPKDFYYAYDGHLNARGSDAIVRFLVADGRMDGNQN